MPYGLIKLKFNPLKNRNVDGEINRQKREKIITEV